MQEQIGQQQRDQPAQSMRSGRRAPLPRDKLTAIEAHRRLQPPLDVEPHPRVVGVPTQRAKQQLVEGGVEEALDVDVEHPVVAPATLARLLGSHLTGSSSRLFRDAHHHRS